MNILTVDPGLDGTGVAVFDIDAWRLQRRLDDGTRALWALRESALIRTLPADDLPLRLHFIADRIESLIGFHCPVKVYVEKPAIEGVYHRKRKGSNQATLGGQNRLHEARGAILAAAVRAMIETNRHPDDVIDFEACGIRKGRRHRMLAVAEHSMERLLKAGYTRTGGAVTLPRGPRGGIPSDQWDAIWIGVQAFTRLEADLRAPPLAVSP